MLGVLGVFGCSFDGVWGYDFGCLGGIGGEYLRVILRVVQG